MADTVFLMMLTSPFFLLPYVGHTATHASLGRLLLFFLMNSWAFSSIGYLASGMFNNTAVAGVSLAFVFALSFSGTLGFMPSSMVTHPGLGSYIGESGFARFPEGIAVEVISTKIIGDVEVHIPVLVVVLPAGGIRELAVAGMQTRFLGHIAEAQASFVPQ